MWPSVGLCHWHSHYHSMGSSMGTYKDGVSTSPTEVCASRGPDSPRRGTSACSPHALGECVCGDINMNEYLSRIRIHWECLQKAV